MDDTLDFLADAAPDAAPALRTFERIEALMQAYDAALLRVEACKRELQDAEAALRRVVEQDIPDYFLQANVQKLTLQDGRQVRVAEEIYCSLAGKHKSPALAWLRETGQDGLIKTTVSVAFGKGEDAQAQAVAAMLRTTTPHAVELHEDVNTASFKALLRELRASGSPVPLETFGAHVTLQARITKP
jgi:hypothetical protein